MKFKALLSDAGVTLLDKRILPSLSKISHTAHLYLTPTHLFFLHNLLHNTSSSSSLQSITQFTVNSIFADYRITSQNSNTIALSLDLTLLHRALKSIRDNFPPKPTSQVQIKLLKKLPPHSTQPMPYLSFEATSPTQSLLHDVPVSKPLSRADVDLLRSAIESSQQIPRALIKAPDISILQNVVERMKQVGEVMSLSIGKNGELGLRVETSGLVALGAVFKGLDLLGHQSDDQSSVVEVKVKNFVKSLGLSLAKPDCGYYGVEEGGGCLVVIYQFFIPGTRETDRSISLHCRIPVLDPGSSS